MLTYFESSLVPGTINRDVQIISTFHSHNYPMREYLQLGSMEAESEKGMQVAKVYQGSALQRKSIREVGRGEGAKQGCGCR